jgi:hypothetical protein
MRVGSHAAGLGKIVRHFAEQVFGDRILSYDLLDRLDRC